MRAIASASGIEPMCQPPSPTMETFSPVLPRARLGTPCGLSSWAARTVESMAARASPAAAALKNSRRFASAMVVASVKVVWMC